MKTQSFIQSARRNASAWAKNLLSLPPDSWVILDTETTGLSGNDEIVQIAVIDGAGGVLVNNQLIKPTVPISPEAQAVHGISMDSLIDAPSFREFAILELDELLRDKIVVIYNADFDVRMMNQSLNHSMYADNGLPFEGESPYRYELRTHCAMKQYAQWFGEWNERRGSFRWQSLQGGDHTALGDCRAVLELIRKMGEEE